jgi:hypothetical protein
MKLSYEIIETRGAKEGGKWGNGFGEERLHILIVEILKEM